MRFRIEIENKVTSLKETSDWNDLVRIVGEERAQLQLKEILRDFQIN